MEESRINRFTQIRNSSIQPYDLDSSSEYDSESEEDDDNDEEASFDQLRLP